MVHIELEEDYGTASGYVVGSEKVQIGNYLSSYSEKAPSIAAWFTSNCAMVAILKNLNVSEAERGNGYGNELLRSFLDEAQANGANAVFLISDSGEGQADGFSLDRWYEGYDFAAVSTTAAGTFMVYPTDIGLQLKAAVFSADAGAVSDLPDPGESRSTPGH